MKSKIERVKELRMAGKSMQEAKRIVERQDLDIEIRDAKISDDLKAILWALSAQAFKA